MPSLPTQLNDFKSLQTPEIFPMEFQVIDVERTLTPVLERAVRSGRLSRSKTSKDPNAYTDYLDQLVKSDKISGLENDLDRRLAVLNGWIRSSLVVFNRKGDKKSREGMDYIRPLTLGIFRSGLPINQTTSRKIDQWVYRTTFDELQTRSKDNANQVLRSIFINALGKGINFGVNPTDNPKYDGLEEIDINAILAMSFLQGFPEPISGGEPRRPNIIDPRVIRNIEEILFEPEAFRPIGKDVVDLLQLYGETLSAIEITDHLAALIAFRLFQAPLRVARVLRATIEQSTATAGKGSSGSNPVEIYSDFTNGKDAHSEALSKSCVQRDLNYCQFLYNDRFLIRALQGVEPLLTERGVDFSSMSMFERIKYLVDTRHEQDFQMALRLNVERFRGGIESLPDASKEEWKAILEDLETVQGLKPEEVLSNLMQHAVAPRALAQQFMWFYSTGGMRTSNLHRGYAILAGTQGAKSTWKYAMTDSVLTSIIMLCFVEGNGSRTSKTLRLDVLLRRMRDRFGILVAEPPSNMRSYESYQAASSNKRAFILKLQLLGCYEGLSDDFSTQRVRRPREATK
jgi:hypothetical protein